VSHTQEERKQTMMEKRKQKVIELQGPSKQLEDRKILNMTKPLTVQNLN